MTEATFTKGGSRYVPYKQGYYSTASFSGESTGVKAAFAPSVPIVPFRWGWINVDDGIVDVGTTFIVSLKKRMTAGSDTAGITSLSTITTGTTDVALGKGLYSDFNVDNFNGATVGVAPLDDSEVNYAPSSDRNTIPKGFLIIPGEELVWNVDDAADTDADAIQGFVHYWIYPFTSAYITGLTKKAS